MFKKLFATVIGRVQGVGFRFYVERMARLLYITGWVKNTQDGHVELVAVGTEDKIKEFLLTIEKGPALANVTEVKYRLETTDINEFNSFEIVMR